MTILKTKNIQQDEMVDFLKESLACVGTLLSRLGTIPIHDKFQSQEVMNKIFRLKAELTEALDEQQEWLEVYQRKRQ